MILNLEETFRPGEETLFGSFSPTFPYGVIFEDDRTTGYLYAVADNTLTTILDALHIYNVANVIDKHKISKLKIVWTDNGNTAGLLINDYCHAVFDFKNKAGYCRNAFPPANGKWREADNDRKLTDKLMEELFRDP